MHTNLVLILTEFFMTVQLKMFLVGHSHWIQLKAFSSSSYANKCIIHRTLKKKRPCFPCLLQPIDTSVRMVTYLKCHMLLPCIHYVLFELQAVFFLLPTFEWSFFNVQMNGMESMRCVGHIHHALLYDFLKS